MVSMFRKKGTFGTKDKKNNGQNVILTLDELKRMLTNMSDVEIMEHEINKDTVTLIYIRTLIDQERVNEEIIQPLNKCTDGTVEQCIAAWNITNIETIGEAQKKLTSGSILLFDPRSDMWSAVPFQNTSGRGIESSETETILYGPKDGFSEQLDQNITLIRRRLPLTELKTETFSVGSLSKTTVVMMYIEGLTNFNRQKKIKCH
jgi:spore germination protein